MSTGIDEGDDDLIDCIVDDNLDLEDMNTTSRLDLGIEIEQKYDNTYCNAIICVSFFRVLYAWYIFSKNDSIYMWQMFFKNIITIQLIRNNKQNFIDSILQRKYFKAIIGL